MAENRPQGRKTTVSGKSEGVYRRGSGLNTGPVGSQNSHPQNTQNSGSARGTTRAGGRSPLFLIIVVLILLLGGGGGGLLGGLFGGSGESSASLPSDYGTGSSYGSLSDYGSLIGQTGTGTSPYANLIAGSTSSGTAAAVNTASVDTSVAPGAREKRTQILGNGQDTVTIMVYMCGTDLESRSGMATRDLTEMARATLSDKVHVLVYTGGCTKWNNSIVSSATNQIYEVTGGGMRRLVEDAGSRAMTDPSTLSEFIRWCAENYPANRNDLIFWDHGGGSVSGYGYDQKFPRSGSMSLSGIRTALKDGGVSFDFVGFDACLMATVETGLMLEPYADYMIASEETEPGIGWYYTDWLTKLSANTSMSTVEIGKNIVDDFVRTCSSQCAGQSATLSVVDIAELSATTPATMKDFSQSLSTLIQNDGYQQVSNARNGAREFARSSAIDQIDLVHFARNLGTDEGKALAEALQGAVKYNRTSSNMSNAYGLSIYFPYRKTANVDKAVKTYNAIGMDESYSQCIRDFASMEVGGQVASGGSNNPYASLLGGSYGGTSSNAIDVSDLLSSFLGGDFGSISGLSGDNTDFLFGRGLSTERAASYIASTHFDPSALTWTMNNRGETVLQLPESQWAMVEGLALNVFFDDGEGYIDLGLDAVFDFDDDGNLLAPTERSWLAINGHTVAYYHEYTVDGKFYGTVPALLNGERVDLLLMLDENGYGTVTGIRTAYADGETETLPKTQMNEDPDSESARSLRPGDRLDFLCDYYRYDGSYENSYFLGESLTVGDSLTICNAELPEGVIRIAYRFTDLYQQHYWSETLFG